MDHNIRDTAEEVRKAFLGKNCWYVSCGGSVGATFQLALGDRVPRDYVVPNPAHSEEYRHYEGETNLLVWCSWRLDNSDRPLTSSDDANDEIAKGLEKLVGMSVVAVDVDMPGWDLTLHFCGALKLRLFCDHLGDAPSFDGNWELWQEQRVISIGAGSVCEVEPRRRLKAAP